MVEALKEMPRPNWLVLDYLLRFLHEVALHQAKNLMNVMNLAIIFGPTLLRPKEQTLEKMASPIPSLILSLLIQRGSLAS